MRALAATGLVFVMYSLKIRMEEKFMIEQFSDAYQEYRRQVKALIPFLY
jgi:protein-S-isoprenylcysteine O-methyltransferase Ste14